MRWILVFLACFLPLVAQANEEDKGRLTRFLENSLSGVGRDVSVEGFQGALSSHASIERIVVSDGGGPWLILSGIELIWRRSALLRGRVEVEKLIAAEITLERLPESESATPTPEAGEFALPELPVSIDIGQLTAGHLFLGEDLLGAPASFSLLGSFFLDGGNGAAKLDVLRSDGPQGHIRFEGGFNNGDRILSANLDVTEAAGGIITDLLNIPGAPSLNLTIEGTGPIDGYTSQLRLVTDGQERLSGVIGTQLLPELNDAGQETGVTRAIGVDIAGDMSPLFAPQYVDFFGPNVSLTAIVRRKSDSRTYLDQLLINTRSFTTKGEMVLAPEGLPERMAMTVQMSDPTGEAVVLPLTSDIKLRSADLDLQFNAKDSDRWSLRGRLLDLVTPEVTLASTTLDGTGTIQHQDIADVTANLSLQAIGITPADADNPDAANALGDIARVATQFNWKTGGPIVFESLELETEQSRIAAKGDVSGPIEKLRVSGQADASVLDLAFLEPILKRPLRGALEASLSGEGYPLTGAFDLTMSATAKNLLVGDKTIDALAGEKTALAISMKRGSEGILLRSFTAKSDAVSAEAGGNLKTAAGALSFSASLDDINRLTSDFKGPLAISGEVSEGTDAWTGRIEGTAPGQTTILGEMTLPKSGGGGIALDINIASVGELFPSVTGSAIVQAKADKTRDGWDIDLDGKGSNIFAISMQGSVDEDLQAGRLQMSGRAPLELLNTLTNSASFQGSTSFDLALNGPFELNSLSGSLATSNARLSMPELRVALESLNANVNIAQSSASLSVGGSVRNGGDFGINGSAALQSPFNGDLTLALKNAKVRVDDLLETELLGDIRVHGPLTGGAMISGLIDLVHTEINVAAAGSSAASIPEISHIAEPPGVFRTRKFAGVLPDPDAGTGPATPPFQLGLTIRANNRIFVRGLGLDAEFEGELGLEGTTESIIASGQFNLARGRLDFMTKRLDLTEGLVSLQGDFIPYLRMVAETDTSEASFEIILEGYATAPDLLINSSPDMPDEEALSLILFGQSIENISAIQAAQLAAAVATLSGQGGGFFGGLRKGIGLDNLDITTDDTGTAAVSAGKHLSERVYTEIAVDGRGDSSISLNLDVNNNITLKGRVDSDSDTGIGIFFRRDY